VTDRADLSIQGSNRLEPRLTDAVPDLQGETVQNLYNDRNRIWFTRNPDLARAFPSTQSAVRGGPPGAAIGAGARYGLVRGKNSRTLDPIDLHMNTQIDLSSGYDTLGAPVPMASPDRARQTVGTARRRLDAHPWFNGVLGIEYSDHL